MNKKLKNFLKRTWIYSLYEHKGRKKIIRRINKLKKASEEEKIKLINERYEISHGHVMNWENPTLYTEKMQWEKLYNNINKIASLLKRVRKIELFSIDNGYKLWYNKTIIIIY